MTRREQELVDQHRQWREQIDATPEQPWHVEPPAELPPREQRLAEAKARRAERLKAPADTAIPTPKDRPEPASIHRVSRLDTEITAEDAQFAAWKRSRRAFHTGRSRGGRSRR